MTRATNKKPPKGISIKTGGRYEARFTTKYGKRVSKTFRDITEAKQWLAQSKLEDDADCFHEKVTLRQWYNTWIAMKEASVKRSSMNTYRHACDTIPGWLMRMEIDQIKPFHIQRMFNELGSRLAKKSMSTYKAIISGMFQQAVDNELINKNPVSGKVTIPKSQKPGAKRKKFLSKDGQKTLIEELHKKPSEKHRLFEFILQTGLRAGEAVGLTWDDIDIEQKMLSVRTQFSRGEDGVLEEADLKTERSVRMIPLTAEAIRILEQQKTTKRKVVDIQYSKVVFLSKQGRPFNISYLDRQLSNAAIRAGLPHISLHTLRHTFATRCAEAKMPLKVLQQVMGHSDIQTTMNIYVHASNDAIQGGMALFEEHLQLNSISPNWRQNGDITENAEVGNAENRIEWACSEENAI